jgi:Nas2 N_terminal domain
MTTTTSCSEKTDISNASLAFFNGTKESLLALNAQRQALEAEAAAIISELEVPGPAGQRPMGVNTPLVDAEGYPRNDIDLYRCKTLRGRLAILQTDLRALYKDTERHLLQLGTLQEQSPERIEADKNEYAARLQPKPKPKFDPVTGKWVVKNWDGTIAGAGKEGGEGRSFDTLVATSATVQAAAIRQLPGNINNSTLNTGTAAATIPAATAAAEAATTTTMTTQRSPFSRVNQVATDSPAFEAGLLENDLIVQFGDISLNTSTATTTGSTASSTTAAVDDAMTRVATLVPEAAAQGRAIQITVLRRGADQNGTTSTDAADGTTTVVSLSLTPKPWSGRGMIGCHIVPYQPAPTVFALPTSSS